MAEYTKILIVPEQPIVEEMDSTINEVYPDEIQAPVVEAPAPAPVPVVEYNHEDIYNKIGNKEADAEKVVVKVLKGVPKIRR